MQNHEPNSPNPDSSNLNLSQSYSKDPLAWCQRLINLGLSGRYGNPEQMMAVIGRGAVLGLDPHTSLEAIYTVGGQTALGVDLMLALVERSGLLEDKRHQYSGEGDKRTCQVWLKRINRTEQPYSFSLAEAKQAGLIKPGGGWTKFPDSMLYARAMSFGLRREFPDVLRGVHSFEEMYVEPEGPKQPVIEVVKEPEPLRAPEGEEKEEKPPRRRRRTKAEMLAARQHEEFPSPVTEALIQQSSPPVPDSDENVDIDKAIPAEVTPYDELRSRSLNSNVSRDEVLSAAKALRVAFEETDLNQIPIEKVKIMLAHWPAILGQISRDKARAHGQAVANPF